MPLLKSAVTQTLILNLDSKALHSRGAPSVLWIRLELFNSELISSFVVPHVAALTSGVTEVSLLFKRPNE